MKKFKLKCSQSYFNGSSTSNETLPKNWNEDLIEKELNELLNEDETVSAAYLSYNFDKSNFSRDDVDSLLGLNGEIEGEQESFYQVGWSKYKKVPHVDFEDYS